MSTLKIAVVSDIHLGHSKNTTTEIIRNLYSAFPDNASTGDLDIIFLAGDVFDTLLSLPDNDVIEIDIWISNLLKLCKKHDIVLRVLEGTPSHDWKQSERFYTINQILKIDLDLKYVKELSIEYIEKFNINVLYIPDEWRSSTDETLNEVRELLAAKGLTHVDYAIMHGAFTFQLPEFVKTHKHDPEAYLRIVKKLVFVGHIHQYNKYDRIYAQGSFDRLAHGEEEPKGHLRATITDRNYSVTFVENKTAKQFRSVDCSSMDLSESLKFIDDFVLKNNLPNGSYVRILVDSFNPILANMNELIKRYPLLNWTKLVNEEEKEEVLDSGVEVVNYIPITITSSNIKKLLLDKVAEANITTNVALMADEILSAII